MPKLQLVYLLVFLFCLSHVSAQRKLDGSARVDKNSPFADNRAAKDKKSKAFKGVANIDMYLQLERNKDTSIVDTTLSLKKLYKFNYLQKDNFGLISFANMGQTYNSLTHNLGSSNIIPLFGARARHFNYMENDDIRYYEVPTPWTRLTYKSAFSQGQLLDAFFTVNLSKQFNFSLAYKGLRSIGNYQNALTSTGNLRMTTNYTSKSNRYKLKAHMVWQDLLNEENGGIKDEDIINFTSGNEEFLDRAVFDPNFENAESILIGKRFYLDQSYQITKPRDSIIKNSLAVNHRLSFEDKYFEFTQDATASDFFGEAFTGAIKDRSTLENFQTEVSLEYENTTLGALGFGLQYNNLNYGYDSVVSLNNETIPNRIKTDFLGVTATYANSFNGFEINGQARLNLSSEFKGSLIYGTIGYQLNDDIGLEGSINISSSLPNYNFLLYQSDYVNYNWYNLDSFENVNTQQIAFKLRSDKYLNVDFDITNIDNFTYFNLVGQQDNVRIIKPVQYQNSLQNLRIKLSKELRFGKFGLDNTILYQNVVSNEDVLNVPDLVTRNTFYFSDEFFKKSMRLQTGVVFNYFTKYNMNGYDPLLAEFYTQNITELGGFPRLDFFVDAKIRQTRIFFIAEHFNSSFSGYDYFSAPNHPYRDFTIRFGLVWDFFL